MSLTEKIEAEVSAAEADVKAEAVTLFDKAKVDMREELPGLMSKLGVNLSDDHGTIHAVLVLLVQLLEKYGPTEIRDVLAGL